VAEANGASIDAALPAAAALELVHTFSLVHDDLPALDDDDVRRGRPSAHVAFGEGVALLAGDALLAEALRVALDYESMEVARDLVEAALGMIGGQYRDITGDDADLEELHRLKTGRLFVASVRLGLDVAEFRRTCDSWIAGDDIGLLLVVGDVIDADAMRTPQARRRKPACRRSRGPRSEPTRRRRHGVLELVDTLPSPVEIPVGDDAAGLLPTL
jgi:geranylgeranyl diphosphate synthase type II